MDLFEKYNSMGKNAITTTRTDFSKSIGEEGTKDIIKSVLLGGNVRDTTEFITQRRLLNSYASMISLFVNMETNSNGDFNFKEYSENISESLSGAKNDAKIFYLWLMGLTKKGFDNVARGQLTQYSESFVSATEEAIEDFETEFGPLTGKININGEEINISWEIFCLIGIAIGSQTLTIRGSSKSMNGKMFEKLVLGTLLTISGFKYCSKPPTSIKLTDKFFWLSNMDANERETDATLIYNGKAINIDIGFIGKGNPEITLDKVTRFGAYKQIGGISHDMSTIIIVDTVGENSDLFNKASHVNGHVLQMKEKDWTIKFAQLIQDIFGFSSDLSSQNSDQLENFFDSNLSLINVSDFFN
ncbi:CfrBI family restriction endonuclease [Lactococcus lactis]|uniref:CfrBI family restriction endonuclease n=1 Tax=Lactococcus lactis TaxID=1358 RepID=UPI001CF14DA6|nr:CfrBI family restriction endonuclease [Lactococcus lactis]UCS89365.1 CfrBI family restriction endonuclease [Lactococcus lactis]